MINPQMPETNIIPPPKPSLFLDPALKNIDTIMKQYWDDYTELYRIVEEKKQIKETQSETSGLDTAPKPIKKKKPDANDSTLFGGPLRGTPLRQRLYEQHCYLREKILTTGAAITPRAQAHNRKFPHETLEAVTAALLQKKYT
jgi:hypothetical protein